LTPPVTVAVVSWNTRELLRACLRSLEPEFEAGRAAVWVVDNASADGSAEMVRDEFPWVELVVSPANLGFGRAVNLVAARTRSDWIAPANADVELRPGALAALLDTGERDPEAGALAPRLVLADGSTQHSVYPLPTLGFTLVFNLGLHRLSRRLADRLCLVGYWDPERAREVGWAVGAFLLVRRVAWDEVGGFDARQWMYAEDLDLGWRLARAGWRRRYEPAAVARHDESAATTKAFGEQRLTRWMEATYEWMVRRRGLVLTRAAAAVNCLGAGVRLAVFTVLARVHPARFELPRRAARFWMRAHRVGLRRRPRERGRATGERVGFR
jgi:N-acetylglucosaminyl-diphospho-decaprenol L-rhamnosyltransferase